MISALFLLTCKREFEELKVIRFFRRMKDKKISNSNKKLDLIIFYDQEINHKYITSVEKYIKKYFEQNINKCFFVNCNIDPRKNIESRFEKQKICGEYGYNSGSASLFYHSINYEITKYQYIMIIEWDITFICDYWLDYLNKDIELQNKFYIYGSKYYGNIDLSKKANHYKEHINGVAVYNRSSNFMKFIEEVNAFHKISIQIKKLYLGEGYDCIINEFVHQSKINKNLFIDSKYIINISPKTDINITLDQIKNKKKDAIIIHQKY
jgi:hypothetical protein